LVIIISKICLYYSSKGSRLNDCCGCHRYDQSALTIITSFFFGYPKLVANHFSANSFENPYEYDLFGVWRGQKLNTSYFV
jgi:hypothetical protein